MAKVMGFNMQVQLRNNIFTATQWFKEGDHPAVNKYGYLESPHGNCGHDGDHYYHIAPGDWIVEMFDGIHLYSDERFKELFEEKEVVWDAEHPLRLKR